MLSTGAFFFEGTPRHRGHDLAVWFVSHAFKQEDDHVEKFRLLIQDTEAAHPGFMSSPVVGLTLFRCIQMTRRDIILCLISEGAHVNMIFRGRSMLHEAVKVSNEAMLAFILSLPGIEKDQYDVDSKTALMEAARGRPRCLKILLQAGCDMMLRDADGDTCLHQCFRAHRAHRDDILACLDILLEYGVDINSTGAEGKTCLQRAVEMSHHWLVKWLILHNCNLHVQVKSSRIILGSVSLRQLPTKIPILIAFKNADRVLVEVMIACGCDFRQYKSIVNLCKSYRLLYNSLVSALSNVDSLQSSCRKVIRRCLTTNIVTESQQLRLPVALQKFILCQEELKALDHSGL